MSVQLYFTIAGVAVTAIVAIIAGFWAITRVAMGQFDRRLEERFATFTAALAELRNVGTERLEKLERQYTALDQDLRKILIELPREYVARTDYVRRETVMEAKIDQLGLRIENWMLKGERK